LILFVVIEILVKNEPQRIGWLYTPNDLAPLPEQRHEFHGPQFPPLGVNSLAKDEAQRLFRACSIHTNVIEGVLQLTTGATAILIRLGFATSSFAHLSLNDDMSISFVQNVLQESLQTISMIMDRIGMGQMRNVVDKEFICRLHETFTKTACIVTHPVTPGLVQSTLIGRGRFKTVSNHVLARTGKYHIYCSPKYVEAELDTLLNKLQAWHKLFVSLAILNEVSRPIFKISPKPQIVAFGLRLGFITDLSISIHSRYVGHLVAKCAAG
jgi:hypothetical protein